MQLINRANLSSEALAALQTWLPALTTLQDFVVWGASQAPPLRLSETVQQDEFTHDVLSALPSDGRENLYLVLGAT